MLLLLLYCCLALSLVVVCQLTPPAAAYTAALSAHQDAAIGAHLVGIGGEPGRAQSCRPVDITVPLCQGIRYNTTSAYTKQSEVARTISNFQELIQLPCAPFMHLFVCSMHLPLCNSEQGLLVLPCREFCTRIRGLCVPVMRQYGYSWPEQLACESLPMEKGGTSGSSSSKNLCLRPEPDLFEAELAELRRLNPHPLLPPAPPPPPPRDLPQTPPPGVEDKDRPGSGPAGMATSRPCSAAEVLLSGGPDATNAKNASGSGRLCAPRCHASLHYHAEDKQFAAAWMLVWSVLCLLCCAVAVATFLLDCSRFCFPERPIVWVAVCYALYSTAHILRVVIGPELACSGVGGGGGDFYRVSRHAGHWCAALFLLLHFSWLAGLLWWLALTFCWYLCAVKKWAHEALAAKAVWLHLAAWGAPLVLSVLLLVLHRIEADELTYLCVVDGSRPANLLAFVIAPCSVALALGLGFLGCALCSSVTVRDSLKLSGNTSFRRLEKLMTKISLFSFLFVLPTACVLAANVYEYVERPGWTDSLERVLARPECVDANGIRAAGDAAAACAPDSRPSSALYMLKIFMSLAAGLPSGLVVWVNGKSARAWRTCLGRLLVRPFTRCSGGGGGSKSSAASAGSKFRQHQHQQPTYTTIGVAGTGTASASASTGYSAATGQLQHQHHHHYTIGAMHAGSVGLSSL